MPYYPTAIPNTTNYPNRTDDIDWIYAVRYNEIKNEMIALCAELGISPSGGYATVVARLNAWLADKIFEGNSSVEVIDTGADGRVVITTEGVEVGKFHSDGIVDFPKQSRTRVYRATTVQSIATATWTKVQFNGESYDEQNEFDSASTYRFTATKAGYYHISSTLRWVDLADGLLLFMSAWKNGAQIGANLNVTSKVGSQSTFLEVVISLAANDYIELHTYHIAGVSEDIDFQLKDTWFEIHKLS